MWDNLYAGPQSKKWGGYTPPGNSIACYGNQINSRLPLSLIPTLANRSFFECEPLLTRGRVQRKTK